MAASLMRVRTLFCDDRRSEREAFTRLIEQRFASRMDLDTVSSLAAVERLTSEDLPFDIVVTDMDFSLVGGTATDGLRILELCRHHWPQCELLVMTAFDLDPNLVLRAADCGLTREAWLPKTADDPARAWRGVGDALELVAARVEARRPDVCCADVARAVLRYSGRLDGARPDDLHPADARLVGCSAQMKEAFGKLSLVAPTPATVLVTGETGTGKELVSQAVHGQSGRSRLVSVNCGAMSEDLIASELFGHVRGAFTGADSARAGLFDQVQDGTLFLDEIGELSLRNQAKLLRVLQTGEYRPIGSSALRHAKARVITATNRDLEAMVAGGDFRSDLFDRLNVYRIHLPPLRERRVDIPAAVAHHLQALKADVGRRVDVVAEQAMWRLVEHDWPENMRELVNTLTRSMIDLPAEQTVLRVEDLASYTFEDETGRGRLWPRILAGELHESLRELATQYGRPAVHEVVREAMLYFDGLPSEAEARRLFGMSYRQWQQWAHYNGLTWEKVRSR